MERSLEMTVVSGKNTKEAAKLYQRHVKECTIPNSLQVQVVKNN